MVTHPGPTPLGGVRELHEDPGTGELRFHTTVRPDDDSVRFRIRATGIGEADDEVEIGDGPGPYHLQLRLFRAGRLRVDLDGRTNRTLLRLQRWDVESASWRDEANATMTPLDGGHDGYVGLAAGRYRVRDVATGRASPATDVEAPGALAQVALDLR